MEGARPATAGDLDRLNELFAEALAELRPQRGGAVFVAREARPEPLEPGFAEALAARGWAVFAGTLDPADAARGPGEQKPVVVGYAVVRTEELRDRTRLAVIEDLYVEAGARGVGVGEALMEVVLAWCRSEGCAGVDALALPGAREVKNFFESAGFSARLLVMHHRLEPAP